MKKNFYLLILVCFIHTVGYAQHIIIKPDFKKIEKSIKKKRSGTYYPKLLERYKNNDTTLSDEDYSLLYYGSFFQKGYMPYGGTKYSNLTEKIFEKRDITLSDYDHVVEFENISLNERPFNLRDLNILAYAYNRSGDDSLSTLISFKKNKLIKTILSSGDGKTEQTAFFVVSVNHEYDMIEVLGFEYDGTMSLTNTGCDYLTVKTNKQSVKGIYFDVNKILAAEQKLSKEL